MADLLDNTKASNICLAVDNGKLKYTMRSTGDLKDFMYLEENRRIAQLTKKSAVVV